MLAMLADSDVDYYDAYPDCNMVNCKFILITSSWPEVNEFVFFKKNQDSQYYIGYTYFTVNTFVKNSKSVSWCTTITMLSMLMS